MKAKKQFFTSALVALPLIAAAQATLEQIESATSVCIQGAH
jgi:hypothetical protein